MTKVKHCDSEDLEEAFPKCEPLFGDIPGSGPAPVPNSAEIFDEDYRDATVRRD